MIGRLIDMSPVFSSAFVFLFTYDEVFFLRSFLVAFSYSSRFIFFAFVLSFLRSFFLSFVRSFLYLLFSCSLPISRPSCTPYLLLYFCSSFVPFSFLIYSLVRSSFPAVPSICWFMWFMVPLWQGGGEASPRRERCTTSTMSPRAPLGPDLGGRTRKKTPTISMTTNVSCLHSLDKLARHASIPLYHVLEKMF